MSGSPDLGPREIPGFETLPPLLDLGMDLERIEGEEGGIHVALRGNLDRYSAAAFSARLLLLAGAGFTRFAFDFRHLSHLSEGAVGCFTGILKEVHPRGGRIVFYALPAREREVLSLLGFDQFFSIVETRREALESLRRAWEFPGFRGQQPGGAGQPYDSAVSREGREETAAGEGPGPSPGDESPQSEPAILACPSCGKTLAVPGPGWRRCPACSKAFRTSRGGRLLGSRLALPPPAPGRGGDPVVHAAFPLRRFRIVTRFCPEREGCLVLRPEGPFGEPQARALVARIEGYAAEGWDRLALDLGGLQSCPPGLAATQVQLALRGFPRRHIAVEPFGADEAVATLFAPGDPATASGGREVALARLARWTDVLRASDPGGGGDEHEGLFLRFERLEEPGEAAIVRIGGLQQVYNSAWLTRRLREVAGAGFRRVALDLGELEGLNPMGLGALTVLLKLLRAVGGELCLFALKPHVREVLDLLGFSAYFHFAADRAEALAFLGARRVVAGRTAVREARP